MRVPFTADPSALQRADAYLAASLPAGTASRARVTAAIRAGALSLNGRPVAKPSQTARARSRRRRRLCRCC